MTDQWGYELFGGIVDEGEDAASTAAREAAEESGWRPVGQPEHLISFEPLPGQVTAPIDVYVWQNADQVGEPTDTEEVGRVEWVPLARVPELARRQELLGSGTGVALLYYLTARQQTEIRARDESRPCEVVGTLGPPGRVPDRPAEGRRGP